MSYARPSQQLKELQQRAAELQVELRQLNRSNRHLCIRSGLLSAMCDALCFIQITLACGYSGSQTEEPGKAGSEAPGEGVSAAQFGVLLESERQLLQQLSAKAELHESQPLAQVLEPEPGTIAPCTDPMQYLQRLVSLPPFEGAATMKAEDVARVFQQSIQVNSIKLHQMQASPEPLSQQHMTELLAPASDRSWQCVTSLVLMGRQDVVEQASSINLDTMVHQPTAAAQHQQAQAVAALPLLGLSEQQQEFISVGTQLYYDLLAAIHQERHKINTEMKAADPDQGGASRASTDDSRVGAGSHACLGSGSEQTLPDRQALLERQQELANRLGLLLRKEYKLRVAAMGWFLGSLTYKQMACLAVKSYPYAMRPLFVATQVMQRWQPLSKSCP